MFAVRCSGAQCDTIYLPLSLVVPLLILTMNAVTGLLATTTAGRGVQRSSGEASTRRQVIWRGVLSASTVLSVPGVIVSAFILRDRPDAFVPAATVLSLLVPVSALIYSFSA